MKKFYFECSICPILRDNIIRYVTNTKKIFTPDFVKQNYHKHFGYSLVLTFFAIWFLFAYAHLGDTGNFFPIFVGGFGAYGVNFLENGTMVNFMVHLGITQILIWEVMEV
jgi:hypothetical protein